MCYCVYGNVSICVNLFVVTLKHHVSCVYGNVRVLCVNVFMVTLVYYVLFCLRQRLHIMCYSV